MRWKVKNFSFTQKEYQIFSQLQLETKYCGFTYNISCNYFKVTTTIQLHLLFAEIIIVFSVFVQRTRSNLLYIFKSISGNSSLGLLCCPTLHSNYMKLFYYTEVEFKKVYHESNIDSKDWRKFKYLMLRIYKLYMQPHGVQSTLPFFPQCIFTL